MNRDPPFNQKEVDTLANLETLISSHKLCVAKSYFILSYCPPTEITEVLNKMNFFAYIYHDCDEKEPHYHYFVTFSNNKDIYNLARDFKCGTYTFMVENVRNRKSALRYLIHLDDGDKFQYALSNVVTNNFPAVERACRLYNPTEDNGEFLKDICNNNAYENAIKYGKDFIKNFERYQQFKMHLVAEDLLPFIEQDGVEDVAECAYQKKKINNLESEIIRKDMMIAQLTAIINELNNA